MQAIPLKKNDDKLMDYLTLDEIQALLDAPPIDRIDGLRDRAMLHIAFAAGLRVSELIRVRSQDIEFHPQPMVNVMGKGRRERQLPLWKETVAALRSWLAVRSSPVLELFINARGHAMSRSGFEYTLAKYVKAAVIEMPQLANKRVSPHVLRHSGNMHTLAATRDIRKVSLWLEHATAHPALRHLDPGQALLVTTA